MRRIALAATVCVAVVAPLGPAPARTDTTRSTVSRATFTGPGFDTCTAPSLKALSAWLASPFRAVGIYVGGANRACADGNLSASWVASATAGGWSLFPLYVGLQAPCVADKTLRRIDPASAAAQGTAAATDAAARAQLFGLGPGVPLYFDMEGYSTTDPACTQVVQRFVSAWVDELHVARLRGRDLRERRLDDPRHGAPRFGRQLPARPGRHRQLERKPERLRRSLRAGRLLGPPPAHPPVPRRPQRDLRRRDAEHRRRLPGRRGRRRHRLGSGGWLDAGGLRRLGRRARHRKLAERARFRRSRT